MNNRNRSHLEERLVRERERTLRSLRRLEEDVRDFSGETKIVAYPNHMADQATDTMEREKTLFLASREGRYLFRIEDALRRLYQHPEGFGICQSCGREIPFERLEALPHARYCLSCKRSEEEKGAAV